MIGAVGLGVVAAACVVVLVPMGMAGYHLSRYKMLFFSGALFITLAIGVHLTPYFPSVTDFVTSSTVLAFHNRRDSCLSHLHDVIWDVTLDLNSSSSMKYHKSWAWDSSSSAVSACGFQKLARFKASDLLNGSWVVVAGDSQARLVAVSLLSLVLDSEGIEKIRSDLFKRHSNYQIVVDEIGMRLDFLWAPYALNLTTVLEGFNRNRNYPDVLVMGTGLWHMLHFSNASDYGNSLRSLSSSASSMLSLFEHHEEQADAESVLTRPPPHLFWIGMPTLINSMLNTEEKREKMTDTVRAAYDEQLRLSNLVRHSTSPFLLLDVESLSWNCGVKCTEDGMHYDTPVYEVALQILLNALLIESHQKL